MIKDGNFNQIVRGYAQTQPNKPAFTFLKDGEAEKDCYSYFDLDRKSRSVAARLQELQLTGERALLLYPSGLDYISSFFGCLYAGVIAVPVSPSFTKKRYIEKLEHIVSNSGAKIILATSHELQRLEGLFNESGILGELLCITTDILSEGLCDHWTEPVIKDVDIAFIQYTSGSTGNPKGVMISHKNMIANQKSMKSAFQNTQSTQYVSWLPMHHDMGLIGNVLQPVYLGTHCVFMSPASFLQKPIRWLEAISHYRGNISLAPNFAFELCAQQITEKQKEKLNLDCWHLALNGAEPIRHDTLARFSEAFESCEFKSSAFFPSYGLAESTLFVSAGSKAAEPIIKNIDSQFLKKNKAILLPQDSPSGTKIVSVGHPWEGDKLCIVNQKTHQKCRDSAVGEIWLKGDSVAGGYWNNPTATNEVFQAYTQDNDGPYMRTGDLGFVHENELFITGRLKDLIIVRGQNYYPQDIESCIGESHLALKLDSSAVFITDFSADCNEELIVIQEIKRDQRRHLQNGDVNVDEIFKAILNSVSKEFSLNCSRIVLLKPGYVPKTSSGKVQRGLTKKRYVQNDFSTAIIAEWKRTEEGAENDFSSAQRLKSRSDKEIIETVRDIWCKVLNITSVQDEGDFFALGGNSLAAIQMSQFVSDGLGMKIPIAQIYDTSDLHRFCSAISVAEKRTIHENMNSQSLMSEDHSFSLTNVQHAYWLGRQNLYVLGNVATHFYQELDFTHLDVPRLENVLNILIKRHDMLRATFTDDGRQKILSTLPQYKIDYVDSSQSSANATTSQNIQWREEMSHQRLDLKHPPLFDIRVLRTTEYDRLYISMDLLVFDGLSIQMFFNELGTLYSDPSTGLPVIEKKFSDYINALNSLKNTDQYEIAKKYWQSRLDQLPLGPQLPLAVNPKMLKEQRFKRKTNIISRNHWDKFKEIANVNHLSPAVVLVDLYGYVLANWSKTQHFLINLTFFNRHLLGEKFDGVIGDFTTLNLLEYSLNADAGDSLKRVLPLQKRLWADLDHSSYTGIELQRDIADKNHCDHDLIAPVVFTGMLNVENHIDEFLKDQRVNVGYGISQTPQIWLDNKVYERDGELVVEWDYVDKLFPMNMLDDMHDAYCALIDYLTIPAKWEAELPSVVPQRTLDLVKDSNSDVHNFPDMFLDELFTAGVNQSPEKEAVITTETTLDYKSLLHQTTVIANHLASFDIEKNTLVAILIKKGVDQVVAALGVLMRGAAYLPIDIEWPEERINKVIKQGEIKVVLTHQSILAEINSKGLYKEHYLDFIAIDDEKSIVKTTPLDNAINTRSYDDIAYTIFTSGSTGEPKGVVISHKNAANTILDINKRFNLTENDKILALSRLSFDLSVYDIFGLLACRGTIVMPDHDKLIEPEHWMDLIQSHHISIWNSVPMLMQMLIDYLDANQSFDCPSVNEDLRLVLLSGDWIPLGLPDRIKKYFPNAAVISLGGATEGSIWSISYNIEEVDPLWKSIPYGKALTNQSIYVLNQALECCPEHVPGEIYIGGLGVAQGYWEDPEKTSKSFIVHPVTNDRLYRTGDWGKLLPTGHVEFLGREDSQVKIGGYRIELGEIEKSMMVYPEVKDVLVDIYGDKFDAKKIACYVVKNSERLNNLSIEEKLEFKGSQKNIRATRLNLKDAVILKENNDDSIRDHYIARKSYRTFKPDILELEQVYQCLNGASWAPNFIGEGIFDSLSYILEGLISKQFAGLILPKYHYPSAGGTYPVQCYVSVDRCHDEFKRDLYYYHPHEHKLIPLDEGINRECTVFGSEITLHFISEMDSISPLYSSYSDRFCDLETGYILEVLLPRIKKAGYGVETDIVDFPAELLGDKKYHFSLNLVSENKQFSIHSDVGTYLYVKPNCITGLDEGIYEFSENALEYVAHWQPALNTFSQLDANGCILSEAAIVVLFAGNSNPENLRYVGMRSQSIMEECTHLRMGTCAIGELAGLEDLRKLLGGSLLHTLAIGRVDGQQIVDSSYSEPHINAHPLATLSGYFKESLRDKLPDYMIPESFMEIDEIPITDNGKVNKHLLPSPVEYDVAHVYEAPINEDEKIIADLWASELAVGQIGRNDNFFLLGGNSLAAVKLASVISKQFKIDLPVRTFFESQTVKEFCQVLEQKTECLNMLSEVE